MYDLIQLNLKKQLDIFFISSVFFAFYIGFRMPNLWCINYYIPSLFDGILRRSFIGTLLYFFGDYRANYYFISIIQLFVFVCLLFIVMHRSFNSRRQLKVVFILYFIGPCGAYMFHEIGYIEQLLYIILIVSIFSNKYTGMLLMLISLFVHEMALFTIIPIYLSILISRNFSYQFVIINITLMVLFFSIIMRFQVVPHEIISEFVELLKLKANYNVRADFYEIYDNSFVGLRQKNYYSLSIYFEIFISCILAYLVAKSYALNLKNSKKQIVFCSIFFACISPIILGFFGWDTSRWVFLSISSCTLMLAIYDKAIRQSVYHKIIFSFLIFTAYGKLEYFDKYTPREIDVKPVISFIKHGFWDTLTQIPTQ